MVVIMIVVVSLLSHVWLFATPWTVACQAPLSMALSKQEYWSELPFPSPGDFPVSRALQVDSLPSEPPGKSYSIHTHTHTHTQILIKNNVGIFVESSQNIPLLSLKPLIYEGSNDGRECVLCWGIPPESGILKFTPISFPII